jgi:Tfp pilus assembly protein PilE
MRTAAGNGQSGVTLVMALLFLAIIAMLAAASFSSSTANLQVTGNMVARNEALFAAQSLIEQTLSSTVFTSDPHALAAATYPVDIDGDGATDYTAHLDPAPTCNRARTIKSSELNPDVAQDAACMVSGVLTNSGIDSDAAAALAGDSLCASTEWNVRATVADPRTSARVAANQGVAVRALVTDAADLCK